jgi:hypothetical protein
MKILSIFTILIVASIVPQAFFQAVARRLGNPRVACGFKDLGCFNNFFFACFLFPDDSGKCEQVCVCPPCRDNCPSFTRTQFCQSIVTNKFNCAVVCDCYTTKPISPSCARKFSAEARSCPAQSTKTTVCTLLFSQFACLRRCHCIPRSVL